ncbi:MAG: glycoside hydrolase family 140 protein [Vicinamibacteria bacterium]
MARVLASIVAIPLLAASLAQAAPLPRLKVSDNRHYLVTEDGKPFFWLGDTAWELFHRLSREDAARYLDDRAQRGYDVVQAVALAEFDGLVEQNAYGHRPLVDNDPTRPDVKEGPANDYWDHVDWVVDQANARGIYVGFLPTWGDKWNRKWGAGPEIFTPANAETYGEWLGRRYRDKGIVWILGGDRPVETDLHREILRATARGLRKGDGGAHLVTLHPTGGEGSSKYFPDEAWLDFHMRQNGHEPEYTGRYDQTRADWDRTPTKPVLDAEPIYEDHPISFDAKKHGHSVATDVRRALYWDLFGGAFGHTYGHHSVWQMWTPERKPINDPLLPWTEAIAQPGAAQMQHGRRLLESRPFLTRVPDDSVIVPSRVPTAVPGAGRYRFVGTRDEKGRYAMVYAPVGRPFAVRMSAVSGARVKAWWFDPREGKATAIGEFANDGGERTFTPPAAAEALDWVLVLDDAAQGYGPPGAAVR